MARLAACERISGNGSGAREAAMDARHGSVAGKSLQWATQHQNASNGRRLFLFIIYIDICD
jgi:hypothetical protein